MASVIKTRPMTDYNSDASSPELLEKGIEVGTTTQDEDCVSLLETPLDPEELENLKREQARNSFKTRLRSYAYSSASVPVSGSRVLTPGPSGKKTNTSTGPTPPKRTSSQTSTTSPSLKRTRTDSPTNSLTLPYSRSVSRAQKRSKDPYNPPNNLVDALRPSLHLVMIGLNPGLRTAETGHAYAHPSNLFWKLLHSSGLTDRRHPPSDTHALMDLYGIGNTNLCSRPTRDGSGLSKGEMEEGVGILDEKIRRFRPEVVCIVGKGIWETIFRVKMRGKGSAKQMKGFKYGWVKDEELWLGREVIEGTGEVRWKGARTFVATTTSGLAAGMRPWEKEEVWKVLGDWIVADRKEKRGEQSYQTDIAFATI